ncbi:MAG: hypothetical protein AAB116_14460 [Candidatus Poribacteria bacterium]
MPNIDIATCVIVCNELIYGALKSEQADENLYLQSISRRLAKTRWSIRLLIVTLRLCL